jgi:diguanylate cyclase (GGDEF)-like protein
VRGRHDRIELPLDVRRSDGARTDGARTDTARSDSARSDNAVLVAAVLDALPSPTLLLDADGTVLLTNSGWTGRAEVIDDGRFRVGVGGNYFAMVDSVRDDGSPRAVIDALRDLSAGRRAQVAADYAVPGPSGTRWFHLQATRVDQAGQIVVTHTDVTGRVRAERASAWQARHDHLTGLPNRAHLHELIDAELQQHLDRSVAVLFLDVDGFKDVNDSLGHDVGDELLRQLAGRLVGETRAQDTVGRLGGDEFVVLCSDCDTAGAALLAGRFQRTFEKPFDLAGRPTRLSISIGVATAPAGRVESVPSTDLVRDADLAMYAAKAAGRNRVRTFDPAMRTAAERRLLVARELREAIEGGQLVLHYQPVMHLPTGQVTGVEALVRWQHPERGLVPPLDFLPLAEQSDLMAPLTRWVLATALRQTAEWDATGLTLITGVNISATHFATGTLVDDVTGALAGAGLPPERLLLELTEAGMAGDAVGAAAQVAELRIRGVEVGIDDFGSGYSSLSTLVSIPAGLLKIDRSLVGGLDDRGGHAGAAVAAVVALGTTCGMRTLAEGVETAGQLTEAADLGCTFAQGFHIARPMPAEEVPGWMAARPVRAHSCGAAAPRLLPAAR